MSFTEVLEANIAAVRDSLHDFKTEVRTDFSEIRTDITSVKEEIKSVRADMTSELKSLREKSDKAFERLFTKFDSEIKETNEALSELSKTVLRIDSRQSAVLWACGGLGALITLAISIGKALEWF